ncbi:MAG TPA: hypothetical protein VE954_05415 [Oligoflexus sp.]|uniref:hypothetical protein n=1 Tax=Oligoflexus sp. TaxID=1971216 RepID=UPI002D69B0C0|nr:hypothetical protein [Oligoflexus sp.]HYX32532.1 hypothetical protein [Oligoflexus sp.]
MPLFIALILGVFAPMVASAASLQFGIAESIITPPMMDSYVDSNGNRRHDKDEPWTDTNQNGRFDPYYIAGFGQNRVATSVHDDLKAVAVSVSSNGKRIVLVSVDTIGWFRHDKDEVAKLVTAPIDLLLIHATHNHEAPDTIGLWGPDYFRGGVNRDYLNHVKSQIAGAIDAAIRQEKPATMLRAELDTVPADLGQIDTRPYPEKLDTRLVTAQFRDSGTGAVLGTLVNFGNHVETLWSGNTSLTADYPGFLRDALKSGIQLNGQTVLEGTGAPVLFIAGNIGGLATTSYDTPVRDPFTGATWIEPSFDKAIAQGRYLAKLTSELLQSPQAQHDLEPSIHFVSRSYKLPVENLEFILAGSLVKLISRPFTFENWGWKVETESHLVRIGGLSLLTVPGELYPEIAVGGLDHPIGGDRDTAPKEWPPLLDIMPGSTRMFANTCNDFLGYIIPASEWDREKPYITGTDNAPYGEGNSLGPVTGERIHETSLNLILESRSQTQDTYQSPFTGQYRFAFDQGTVDPMNVDALGRIEGKYTAPGGSSFTISGYVSAKGELNFWIENKVKAQGAMAPGRIEGTYESRDHPGVVNKAGTFQASF